MKEHLDVSVAQVARDSDLIPSTPDEKGLLAVVSVSGGKDSTEAAFRARERVGLERCRFVFADTGNEHEYVYDYLYNYLPTVLGAPIETVRADFANEIARKRAYCETEWPKKGIPDDVIRRVLAVLHPTGNPFLDLCLWKGRFPSRRAQFCTQYLKRHPLDKYLLDRLAEGFEVESWRGIRRNESDVRRNAPDRALAAEGWTIVNAVAALTSEQVIESLLSRGIRLNPLYRLGFARVGCLPCINCSKDELLEIWRRFPRYIDIKREWEELVSLASKRGFTTFFTDSAEEDETSDEIYNRLRIDERVLWAQTAYGGKQFDFLRLAPPTSCSSVYGLCD